jgi:hypothetical protein
MIFHAKKDDIRSECKWFGIKRSINLLSRRFKHFFDFRV